jgi:hypothetical protein
MKVLSRALQLRMDRLPVELLRHQGSLASGCQWPLEGRLRSVGGPAREVPCRDYPGQAATGGRGGQDVVLVSFIMFVDIEDAYALDQAKSSS